MLTAARPLGRDLEHRRPVGDRELLGGAVVDAVTAFLWDARPVRQVFFEEPRQRIVKRKVPFDPGRHQRLLGNGVRWVLDNALRIVSM